MDKFDKNKFNRGVKWLGWSAVLSVASVGGWLVYITAINRAPAPVEVHLITVERGDIEISLNESGTVELSGQQTLKSPIDGAVERVLVQVGDRVEAGQELLALRNTEQQTTLATKPLEIGKQELTVAGNRQKVTEAQEALAIAQGELKAAIAQGNSDREIKLAAKQWEIQKQELILDSNRQKLTTAEKDLVLAEKEVQALETPGKIEGELGELLLDLEKQKLQEANDRQKVVEAEETVAIAQRELDQLQTLAQRGFIPGNDIRDQQEKIRGAQSQLREAQLTLASNTVELEKLELRRQGIEQKIQKNVADAQNALREAQKEFSTASFELQRLQIELKEIQQQPEEKIAIAQKTLRDAQSNLRQAQVDANTESLELQKQELEGESIEQQLQYNIVTAPIAAKVLDIQVKNGDGIERSKDLLTLGNTTQELVKLQLSTLNAVKVRPNQEARISVIGPGDRKFTGRVRSLSPIAIAPGTEGQSSQSSTQASVAASVQLDSPSGTLIPGSQVSVEIILDQRQNVVVLETEAIQSDGPQSFVWVRDSQSKAQKQPITLGLEGLTTVEVSSGLKPGDEIVLPPREPPLEPGTPVIEEQKKKGKVNKNTNEEEN